ncbi:MAG: hypothetical protein CK424_06180 [Legionella sp.]|nr:MAG: hypothetical protein CK424_06180 [Legionella sp.]
MHTQNEPTYLYDNKLASRPLFEYAQFAFQELDRRFPKGAATRVSALDEEETIISTLIKSNQFKDQHEKYISEQSSSKGYTTVFSELQSGDAELLTNYLLGYLRTTYPDSKALFHLVTIQQDIPSSVIHKDYSGSFPRSHSLLLIGTGLPYDVEKSNFDTFIVCDFWSREVYLGSDFGKLRAQHLKLKTYGLLQQSDKITLAAFDYDYLSGDIAIPPKEHYLKYDSLVQRSFSLFSPSMASHEYLPFAQEVFQKCFERFPEGSVNKLPYPLYAKKIKDTLQILREYKNAHFKYIYPESEFQKKFALSIYQAKLHQLRCGDSELLASYALGYLRYLYPKQKELFQLASTETKIKQNDLNIFHYFLLIGDFKKEPSLGNHILCCDLELGVIYLASDFNDQTLSLKATIYTTNNTEIEKINYNPSGKLTLYFEQEKDNEVFDSLFQSDLESSLPPPPSAKKALSVSEQSMFATSLKKQSENGNRKQWERTNSTRLGYFVDTLGNEQELRKVNKTQYAYWDSLTNKQTPVQGYRVAHDKGCYKIRASKTEPYISLTKCPKVPELNSDDEFNSGMAF